ncbi:MAG: hypothetical protein KF819_04295 [Labilithrix sp.]|nr:hypothetical protein [Labilithrix sp.]
MTKRVIAMGMGLLFGSMACGPAPNARPANVPPNAVRVVPASQVKGTCLCDDDEYDDVELEAAPRRGVEYVKLDDWSTPNTVKEWEAAHPPGSLGGASSPLPALTLHRPIDETRAWGGLRRFSSRAR